MKSRQSYRSLTRKIAVAIACLCLSGCPAPSPRDAQVQDRAAQADSASSHAHGARATGVGDTPAALATPDSRAALYRDAAPGKIQFVDALPGSGINFRHTDGGGAVPYITQTVVAGLALFDYDGDGYIDIYFLNGSEVPGNPLPSPPTNALYRNNGDGTFTDVSHAAGVADTGYGLGVAVADYNNDGCPDLYVNNFGANVLYRNNGDGTFTDVTAEAGCQSNGVGAGVSFLDVDADGNLDLYVANYVDFRYDNHLVRTIGEYEYAAAPTDYNPQADVLFRNNGDGTFTDISEQSGISALTAPSMGVISFDLDEDGDVDLMVCCDNAPNLLLRNDGTGRFEEVGVLAGVAHDLYGSDNGSMGVDAGDFDNDGLIDLFVTNYQGEMSLLYRNTGNGFFSDVSQLTGAGASSFPHVTWGTGFIDFDSDGDRDLFIACGHFIEHIANLDDRTAVRVPNIILENLGNGRFEDVSRRSGVAMGIAQSSKGAGFDDLNNNGHVDVVLLNANDLPTLLRNQTQTTNRGFLLQLVGIDCNRDAVGAKVKVISGDKVQVAEVHSGRGYQSHFGSRLHFGLGNNEVVDRIEVHWLGGGTDVFEHPEDSLLLQLFEGGQSHVLIPRQEEG
jgi:enediyne biosynthesis protein E4